MYGFCSICNGVLLLLGVLGNMRHLECNNCGAHFHENEKADHIDGFNQELD